MKKNTPETICEVTRQPIGGEPAQAHDSAYRGPSPGLHLRNRHLYAHEELRLAVQAVKRFANPKSQASRYAPSYLINEKHQQLEATRKRFDEYHAENFPTWPRT